jgi:choline dehydrogenase-like flavoprotein
MVSRTPTGRPLADGSGALGRFFMEHPRIRNRYHVRPGDTPLARFVGVASLGTLRFTKVTIPSGDEHWGELLTYHANLQSGYVGELAPGWPAVRRLAIRATRPWNEMPYYHGSGGGRLKVRLSDVGAALRRPDLAVAGAFAVATQPPSMRRFVEIYSGIEQAPDPANRLEVLPERDPLGMPRVRLHWTVGDVEERTYRRGLELVLAHLERLEPGISGARLEEEDPWPSRIEGTWHHIGTTRMDDDPATGVVDRHGRVHGIDNLHVVGSSVFPVSASLAPTVTIVQLSLRLAEHLAGTLVAST